MIKVLTVMGTRPEAIKMAPVIKKLAQQSQIEPYVCVTAQHREMLDQVLKAFDIVPEYDLNVMAKNQSLTSVATKIMSLLEPILNELKPDAVLVHGDTATTFAASLASFYAHIPVMHIEAGLRTYNLKSPFPEEAHRQLTSTITALHFAPSNHTAQNLYNERIHPDKVIVTGNTVIDALMMAKQKIDEDKKLSESIRQQFHCLDTDREIILVTVHRRENFGEGIVNIINAIKGLSEKYQQMQIVIPVHLNPKVQDPIRQSLAGINNVFLIEPQDYLPFIWLMSHSKIILTDSGGIQEEAPSLGVPVLVMRDTTERQEAINAGTVKLVGTHTSTIVSEASLILDNPKVYNKIAATENPYGDGHASDKIVKALIEYLEV